MKNKDFAILMGLIILLVLIVYIMVGCKKIEVQPPAVIDLGVKPMSTAIKQITETNNVVTVKFQTTPGAKYSVHIIPFGSDEPVLKDGFTASDSVTNKLYNLKDLPKRNYDFLFMDIAGHEVKYPITIK